MMGLYHIENSIGKSRLSNLFVILGDSLHWGSLYWGFTVPKIRDISVYEQCFVFPGALCDIVFEQPDLADKIFQDVCIDWLMK